MQQIHSAKPGCLSVRRPDPFSLSKRIQPGHGLMTQESLFQVQLNQPKDFQPLSAVEFLSPYSQTNRVTKLVPMKRGEWQRLSLPVHPRIRLVRVRV